MLIIIQGIVHVLPCLVLCVVTSHSPLSRRNIIFIPDTLSRVTVLLVGFSTSPYLHAIRPNFYANTPNMEYGPWWRSCQLDGFLATVESSVVTIKNEIILLFSKDSFSPEESSLHLLLLPFPFSRHRIFCSRV